MRQKWAYSIIYPGPPGYDEAHGIEERKCEFYSYLKLILCVWESHYASLNPSLLRNISSELFVEFFY